MIVLIRWIIRVGCVVLFEGDSCYIKNKKGKVIGKIQYPAAPMDCSRSSAKSWQHPLKNMSAF
jgi:hypothetical protein